VAGLAQTAMMFSGKEQTSNGMNKAKGTADMKRGGRQKKKYGHHSRCLGVRRYGLIE